MTSNDRNLACEQLGLGHVNLHADFAELDAELQGQDLLHILSGRRNPLQSCEFQ